MATILDINKIGYITLSNAIVLPHDSNWTLKLKINYDTIGSVVKVLNFENINAWLGLYSGRWILYDTAAGVDIRGNAPDAFTDYIIDVANIDGTVYVFVDDQLIGSDTQTADMLLRSIGVSTNSNSVDCAFYYMDISSASDHYYNADSGSSNAAGNVLYDDVSGNNGALVGDWPDDNSQWQDDGTDPEPAPDVRTASWSIDIPTSISWQASKTVPANWPVSVPVNLSLNGVKTACAQWSAIVPVNIQANGHKEAQSAWDISVPVQADWQAFKQSQVVWPVTVPVTIGVNASKSTSAQWQIDVPVTVTWFTSSLDVRHASWSIDIPVTIQANGHKAAQSVWDISIPVQADWQAFKQVPAAWQVPVPVNATFNAFKSTTAAWPVAISVAITWHARNSNKPSHPNILILQGVDAPIYLQGVHPAPIYLQGVA